MKGELKADRTGRPHVNMDWNLMKGELKVHVDESSELVISHRNLTKRELKAPICVVCHAFHGLALNLKKQ